MFLYEDIVGFGYWIGVSRLWFDDMFVIIWLELVWIVIGWLCGV